MSFTISEICQLIIKNTRAIPNNTTIKQRVLDNALGIPFDSIFLASGNSKVAKTAPKESGIKKSLAKIKPATTKNSRSNFFKMLAELMGMALGFDWHKRQTHPRLRSINLYKEPKIKVQISN
jgi:hypothetical protein